MLGSRVLGRSLPVSSSRRRGGAGDYPLQTHLPAISINLPFKDRASVCQCWRVYVFLTVSTTRRKPLAGPDSCIGSGALGAPHRTGREIPLWSRRAFCVS